MWSGTAPLTVSGAFGPGSNRAIDFGYSSDPSTRDRARKGLALGGWRGGTDFGSGRREHRTTELHTGHVHGACSTAEPDDRCSRHAAAAAPNIFRLRARQDETGRRVAGAHRAAWLVREARAGWKLTRARRVGLTGIRVGGAARSRRVLAVLRELFALHVAARERSIGDRARPPHVEVGARDRRATLTVVDLAVARANRLHGRGWL